ncbi:AAA family ATPase [Kitasatospora hibisci]|uniref:AAA family ATPase n=1 Tax=Kitasatospora hibisci TaxID=3369522 RepID=UPI0037542FED
MAEFHVPLVDREQESKEFELLLAELGSGRSAVAVVDGRPGIGKTAILDALDRGAHSQGAAVLRARCSAIERDFPFGVVRQLLAPALAVHDPDGMDLTGLLEEASGFGGTPAAFDVLEGLCASVLRLAERQVVALVVDDVQWADEQSASWLAFLARRLGEVPVLLAVGSRGLAPTTGYDLAGELMLHPACRVIQPAALTVVGVSQLLNDVLGDRPDDPFSTACHALSGGNPAVLAQLVRELARAGVAPHAAELAGLAAIGSLVLPVALRNVLRRESPEVLQTRIRR